MEHCGHTRMTDVGDRGQETFSIERLPAQEVGEVGEAARVGSGPELIRSEQRYLQKAALLEGVAVGEGAGHQLQV